MSNLEIKSSSKIFKSVRRDSTRRASSYKGVDELQCAKPLNYLEAIMHLIKANIGTGCFAMPQAFMNSGLLVGSILTFVISLISLHCQHVLLQCSKYARETGNPEDSSLDYASTIEACFLRSKDESLHKFAKPLKYICDIFICITQLGFCIVYLMFVSEHISQVLSVHGIKIDITILIALTLIPIWLSALIRQLKYIAILSACANICMVVGLLLTLGFISSDLPPINTRPLFVDFKRFPLFFGTILFAFEGIALVMPLRNSMKKPENFSNNFGVLNVGVAFVTLTYATIGFMGFWKYGDGTLGSLTLNLDSSNLLSQTIKMIVSIGIALGFAIQFFVAINILFSYMVQKWGKIEQHPKAYELIFRSIMVLLVLVIAEFVPNFSLLLAFIGSVCCTVLSFVLPILGELAIYHDYENGVPKLIWVKNSIILTIAFIGMVTGGTLSFIDMFMK